MADTLQRIAALDGFWTRQYAYYLNEHRHPGNRLTHLFGIPILIITGVIGLAMLDLWVIVIGQLIGWALQILGHRIEGNRPALFKRPGAFLMGPLMVLTEILELLGVHFGFARAARRIIDGQSASS